MIPKKTSSDLVKEMFDHIKATTGINSSSPGSVLRGLLEILGKNFESLYSLLDTTALMSSIFDASGDYLDSLGYMVGLKRLPSTKAYVTLRFTAPVGTVIQAGVPVSDGQLVFFTLDSIVFDAGNASKDVLAIAEYGGAKYNVPANTLTKCNIQGVSVTNPYPAYGGADQEDDASFRFRIANSPFLRSTGNEKALVSAVMSIPAVADAVYIDKHFGNGTAAIMIRPVSLSSDNTRILEIAQSLVDALKPAGSMVKVILPSMSKVYLDIKLSFIDTEDSNIKESIKTAIKTYIDNLDIGEGVLFDSILRVIYNTSSQVDAQNTHIAGAHIERVISDGIIQMTSVDMLDGGLTPFEFEKFTFGDVLWL